MKRFAALTLMVVLAGCSSSPSKPAVSNTAAPAPSVTVTAANSPTPRIHPSQLQQLDLFLGCREIKLVLAAVVHTDREDQRTAAKSLAQASAAFRHISDPVAQQYAGVLRAGEGPPSSEQTAAQKGLAVCRASHAFAKN